MPVINPYANQMATMQTLGIPAQTGQPPAATTPPPATPPVATPPGSTTTPPQPQNNPANGPLGALGRRNPATMERMAALIANRGMNHQAVLDWRGQRPMDVQSPDFRAALQQWRSSRPQRTPFNPTAPNPAAVSGPTTLPGA